VVSRNRLAVLYLALDPPRAAYRVELIQVDLLGDHVHQLDDLADLEFAGILARVLAVFERCLKQVGIDEKLFYVFAIVEYDRGFSAPFPA
jgi:hypothetical protein